MFLASAVRADDLQCLGVSGRADVQCLESYSSALERCRRAADAACEDALRTEGGTFSRILARPEPAIRAACTDATSEALGYNSAGDVVTRAGEWCVDFGEDLADLGFADNLQALDADERVCQRAVAGQLRWLRRQVVRLFGSTCSMRESVGGVCSRARRDHRVTLMQGLATARIEAACGEHYAGLELGPLPALIDAVTIRARHYAVRVYPPNNLGPAAAYGPYPVGVTTLELQDPARMNVPGTGPRPVVTEVYYPSTAAAIEGVPRDIVKALNIPLLETPSYRDVAVAQGPFPVVLFSHGNLGIRFQSFFFAAHLASHGYIVVSPDHHGNTFVDAINGMGDSNSSVNRPLDLSFLIDQFLAFNQEDGNRFQGAVRPDAIGASGHSFGGFTALTLAGPQGDPRIKAILPQAPFAPFDQAFLQAITVPVLIMGGSIDETTPFQMFQQQPYEAINSGAAVVALAELANAGHFTFSDFCEVDRELLEFLGGYDEACEPRHIPWRHAHDIINYLALNFFDATLLGNQAALDRLAPSALAGIDDLRWQSK